MASLQEILQKYLNKSSSPDVNTYLANQLNANKVVADAARKTFEPKSFRQEEPVQSNIQQLPQRQLEQVVPNIIPNLADEYAAQQANPATAINVPQVQSTTPITEVKSIEQKINENPQLFSSDRVWAALREARGSDLSGEGFAAGYGESPTGIPNPNDVIDADPAKRQRAMDWYRDYLKSHPEIVNREEEKKASLASATPYTGLLQEQLKNASPEKQIEIAKELESILGSRAKEAESTRLKELELSSKNLPLGQQVTLEEIKSGIITLPDGTKVNTEKGIVVRPDGVVEKTGGLSNSLTQGAATDFQKKLVDGISTVKAIDSGLSMIKADPNAYNFLLGILPPTVANRLDNQGIQTRTSIDRITAEYRKWLTGAQMSDKEREAYERFLPAPTDNGEIVTNKLLQMKKSIEDRNNILREQLNQTVNSEVNPNDVNDNLQNLIDATNSVNNIWEF